ncbi:LCP family glycopolymer transferase CpsA [Streptococcus uberis]|uniref:LCP family glycopolymer transferase CpsA n=1 Tax=Streptococcus uberis TaxID=1349 RepID=UPI000541E12F|nr:LCP family protein [Streptococcus uberis]KHD40930.1 LytR family transcriptional regulator [Streptococcus hongkongensis]SQG46405.1 integral membrane regulatory protein Wzg [Streptococcus uberis]
MISESRSNKSSKNKKSSSFTIINLALVTLFALLALIVSFMMYSYNFLAFHHLNLIVALGLLALFIVSLLLIILKKAKLLTMIGLILANIGLAVTLFAFKSTIDFTGQMNKTASFSEVEMSVIAAKDSSIASIQDLKSVEAPTKMDRSNIEALLEQAKIEKKVDLETVEVDSYQKAYENLLSGSSQAMVINSAYSSLIEQNDPDYSSKVKTLYSYKVKKDIKTQAKTSNKEGVYNIYVSGIDTYGPISTVSRSDVNIIITLNMNTHKVLLTTTPRDSYLKIPDGGGNQYDKLTHAGIYGVETSMKTLSNLYDISVDHYARINFTSFINLIDQLGGIEVENTRAFSANGLDFPAGTISLNSQQALVFVRERHALEGGDNDRGKNQEKVIAAIINKLSSIKSPSQFSAIMTGLQSSVQTDMTLDQMMAIVNTQLEDSKAFTITSQDVTGTGSTGELPSYAMPGSALYMYQLDESSVNQAKEAIKAVMEESK